MALVASSISGAAYALNSGEDRENSGTGFEFTRRKKWPQLLLQEMSGSALFCIKPIAPSSDNGPTTWKIMYASPSVGEMTDQKPSELEGHDFLDLIYSPDQLHLTQLFQQLLSPTGGDPPPLTHHRSSTSTETTSSSSTSQAPGAHGLNFTSPYNQTTTSITGTTFVRILTKDIAQKETVSPPNSSSDSSAPSSSSGDNSPADVPTVVWEVRAHVTGIRDPGQGTDGTIIAPAGGGFRLNGGGTMAPDIGSNAQGAKGAQGEAESLKGKAIWLMGRRVGENQGEADGAGGQSGQSGQSLDAFLELKLENEKLREELKELQLDLDEYEDFSTRDSYADASPSKPTYNADSSSEEDEDSSISSSPSSSPEPSYQPPSARGSTSAAAAKAARPKEKAAGEPKEKKRKKEKKAPPTVVAKTEGGPVQAVAEGMHVCVTCGRTDSPEWRKGPLGPKTLCNACGLRWAKRNSTAPTRKDRKAAADKK